MSTMNDRPGSPLARRAFLGSAVAGATTLLGGRALFALERLSPRRAVRPLRMAVIGDSIMWGQGLRLEEKFWLKTKQWLTHELDRPIEHSFFAHSGAKIQPYPFVDNQPPLYGEIPSSVPSVIKQAQLVDDPHGVDFVLLDGGANDVGLSNVLAENATLGWIADEMRSKCGERMREMLCYLVGNFPNARFVVTGYYPLVSAESFAVPDAVVVLLQHLFGLKQADAASYARDRNGLLQKSNAFADESSKWLQWAVNETNQSFPNRAVFVKPAIYGDRCLAALDSHIWGLEDDPVRLQRTQQCQATGRLTVLDFETMEAFPKFDIVCPIASILHPNAKGANRYFEAIVAELPKFFPVWRA